MKPLLTLPCLAAVFLLPATSCSSGGSGTEPAPSDTENLADLIHHTGADCICGSARADIYGCYCENCLLHGGNPSNPDCMCLPLTPRGSGVDPTVVSIGGTSPTSGGLMGMDVLVLLRGGRVEGTVISDDGETVVFRRTGGAEESYAYEDLNTRSIYKLLLSKTRKDDAQAEFRLATYAGDIGLYAHCRRHYGFAVQADPSLEPKVKEALAQLDGLIAADELAIARAAVDKGKDEDAVESLSAILTEHSDQPAAHDAAILMEGIESRRRAKAREAGIREYNELVATAIEPARERLEKARENNQKALTSKSGGNSVRYFKAAASDGESARSDIGRARQRTDDSSVLDALAVMDQQASDLLVEVYINLGSTYSARNDYGNALSATNNALALAPDDERATQMRARIETAKNAYWSRGRSVDPIGSIGIYGYGYRSANPMRGGPNMGLRIGYGIGWY